MNVQHVSGKITCPPQGKPGCTQNQPDTVITDNKNQVIMSRPIIQEQEKVIVFIGAQSRWPIIEKLPFKIRVWNKADLEQKGQSGVSGLHEVEVFVTLLQQSSQVQEKQHQQVLEELQSLLKNQIEKIKTTKAETIKQRLEEQKEELKAKLAQIIKQKPKALRKIIQRQLEELSKTPSKDQKVQQLIQQQHAELKRALEQVEKQQPQANIVQARRFQTLNDRSVSQQLMRLVQQQISQMNRDVLMQPELLRRLQENRAQIQRKLTQFQQRLGQSLKTSIQRLFPVLRSKRRYETGQARVLINQQIQELRQMLQQLMGRRRSTPRLESVQRILENKIEEIRMQLQNPSRRSWQFLQVYLRSLQNQLQRVQQSKSPRVVDPGMCYYASCVIYSIEKEVFQ